MAWTQRWRDEGGGRDLLRLALPLILSSSFLTLQITIDRALLAQWSSDAIAAAMPAALFYWTPFVLLQNTANYATTFVAQYTGAGRPHRVGPAVWQALYFAVFAGIAFLALLPLIDPVVRAAGHKAEVQELESTYLYCLCFAALPALIVAAANSFFAGRGDSWTVLLVDAAGLAVNTPLAYAWIGGHWGFPAWGIAGAGWATVAGSSVSALVALCLLFRPRHRAQFATLSGWRFEAELFRRLLRFGVPNGLQWMLDGVAFTAFIVIVGWIGVAPLAATNTAFAINMVAILPMLGMAQAVSIRVGQSLGRDRPDLATRSTWTGFALAWIYMSAVSVLYVLTPEVFVYFFRSDDPSGQEVAAMVPVLLRFVAIYSLFDSLNLVFSFVLRGAGDTRFVTIVALALAWPVMVLPTLLAYQYGWGLYWAWAFASVYVIVLGFVFLARFLAGKWKTMRVIEQASPAPVEPEAVPV